jgi:hypothetical protein
MNSTAERRIHTSGRMPLLLTRSGTAEAQSDRASPGPAHRNGHSTQHRRHSNIHRQSLRRVNLPDASTLPDADACPHQRNEQTTSCMFKGIQRSIIDPAKRRIRSTRRQTRVSWYVSVSLRVGRGTFRLGTGVKYSTRTSLHPVDRHGKGALSFQSVGTSKDCMRYGMERCVVADR